MIRRARFQKGDHNYYFRWDERSDGKMMDTISDFAEDSSLNLDTNDALRLSEIFMDSFGREFTQRVLSYYERKKV